MNAFACVRVSANVGVSASVRVSTSEKVSPSIGLWTIAILALSVPGCVRLDAQWLNYPTPGLPRAANGKANLTAPAPRTSDGHPDFSGNGIKFPPKYARNIARRT